MPDTNETGSSPKFSLDLGILKTVFDVSWKLIPLLWCAFQFAGHQDELLKAAKSVDSQIAEIAKHNNELDRRMVELGGKVDNLKTQIDDDRAYYIQVAKKR